MYIECGNIREYIMTVLSLTGQLNKTNIQLFKGGKHYTQQAVRYLVNDNYLNNMKTEAGVIYRPKKPKGLNYIFRLPAGYYDHYLLISNNHGYLYHKKDIARASSQASVIMLFLNIGAKIDGIRIAYNPDVKKKSKGEGGSHRP